MRAPLTSGVRLFACMRSLGLQTLGTFNMKILLLTLFLALPIAYLFGEEEYTRLGQIEEISNTPGFAPAIFEGIIQTESKKSASFRVKYRYEVNGQQYRVTTTPTDQQGALTYVSQQDMQVAYSTRQPSVGMIKRYYDLRNPQDSLTRSLTVTSILAIGLALPIALGISRRLGWLKWGKKR